MIGERMEKAERYRASRFASALRSADAQAKSVAAREAVMSPEQRMLARYALGLPSAFGQSCRNHVTASPGSEEYAVCRELVALGFAHHRPANARKRTDDVFWLTLAGADRALEAGERLDPKQFPTIGVVR